MDFNQLIMKKINKNRSIILMLLLITAACNESWLEPQPLSFYSPENSYNTVDGMKAGLLGVRKQLRHEWGDGFQKIVTEYYWTDISLGAIWLANFSHDATLQLLPTSEPQNSYMNWYWNNAYTAIKNVNIIISRIDLPEYNSEEERNAILGEAYFHRAYWYYRLANQFGDVPFVEQELISPRLDFMSHSRETIFQKIKKDMEFAVQWMDEDTWGGIPNRAAGYHLLTKIYLACREFDNAINAANRVIDGGKYALMTDRFGKGLYANDPEYDVLWDLHRKENKSISANTEAILVAQDKYETEGNSNGGSAMMRVWVPYWRKITGCEYNLSNGADAQEAKLGRGNSWVRTSDFFNYNMRNEDPNDQRYNDKNWHKIEDFYYNKASFAKFGEPIVPSDVGADTTVALFPFFYYKLFVAQERSGTLNGGYTDFYIFRLAETYLLRAEAYWWKGDLANAAKDINVVRARAGASAKKASDITLDYIFTERARELYQEEPRKTELTRVAFVMASLNKDGYSLEDMSEKNWYHDKIMRTNNYFRDEIQYGSMAYRIRPYHVYWPIPQSAIDANSEGHINQNLGYQGSENNIEPLTEIKE